MVIIKKYRYFILFVFFITIILELLGYFSLVKENLLPRPSTVLIALADQFNPLIKALSYTFINAIFGFFISLILGFILAILMDKSIIASSIIDPLFTISQNIPILAIAPLFVIWFGFGITSKILIILLVCVFPITLSFFEGLKQTPKPYISFFKTINASQWSIYRYVKIPFATPYLFSGMKISMTYAMLAAIIAEWSGGSNGIGIYLIMSQKSFKTAQFFAAIVMIVVTSLFLIWLLKLIEKMIYKKRRV